MHECALCSIRCWLAARTFRCLNLFSAVFSVSAPLSWHGRAQGKVEDDLESLKAFGAFILQGSLWYFALIGLCSVFLLIFFFQKRCRKKQEFKFFIFMIYQNRLTFDFVSGNLFVAQWYMKSGEFYTVHFSTRSLNVKFSQIWKASNWVYINSMKSLLL